MIVFLFFCRPGFWSASWLDDFQRYVTTVNKAQHYQREMYRGSKKRS